MKHDNRRPTPSSAPPRIGDEGSPPLSSRGLAIVFGALAIALVVGYLFVNKLVDMSQEEDCALAHRYNCGAVEVPR